MPISSVKFFRIVTKFVGEVNALAMQMANEQETMVDVKAKIIILIDQLLIDWNG